MKADKCPRLSIIGVLSAACCNIMLDYVFVLRLHMGVRGAAYATVISQMLSASIFFIHFLRKKSILGFCRFKFDFSTVIRSIKTGVPDFVAEISTGITIFLFNRVILSVIGENGIVTYTVISYTSTLVLNTMLAISQGVQPLISYNYGKNDKQAIISYLKYAIRTAIMFSLLSYVLVVIFPAQISRLFVNSGEAELISYSVKALRIYALSYLVVGFNIVICGFYTAIEKPKFSLIISSGRGLVVISTSLLLMAYFMGDIGVWLSTFVSESICFLASLLMLITQFRPGSEFGLELGKMRLIDGKKL